MKPVCLGVASALAVMIGFSSGASASTVPIDGIAVTDWGTSSSSLPTVTQPTPPQFFVGRVTGIWPAQW